MKSFQNIVVIKSDPALNTNALDAAVTLAKQNNARLTLADITPELPKYNFTLYGFPDETVKRSELLARNKQKEQLEKLAERHNDGITLETTLLEGKPYLAIIKDVLTNKRDLVIKATEGKSGLFSGLFSSTDMKLLRKCPSPVWLIKPQATSSLKHIVAAVDLDFPGIKSENSALNKKILQKAFALAAQHKAQLDIIHAWMDIDPSLIDESNMFFLGTELARQNTAEMKAAHKKQMASLMNSAKEWVGSDVYNTVNPQTYVIQGITEQVIDDHIQSAHADLLIMGTIGRTGIPGFFIGNTAESILGTINCSVLALKPEGFISPVNLEE